MSEQWVRKSWEKRHVMLSYSGSEDMVSSLPNNFFGFCTTVCPLISDDLQVARIFRLETSVPWFFARGDDENGKARWGTR